MFHPIGSQPPSVYWRRRLIVVAAAVLLVVLVVLTANALGGNDGRASTAPSSSPSRVSPTSQAAAAPASAAKTSRSSGAKSPSSAAATSRSTTQPIGRCTPAALAVVAAVGQPTYKVGQNPLLQLQVTNTGTRPCVQDLADAQVELRVYNGESRVWGSHDCKTQPGTLDRTLSPNVAVKVAISWTGLSSQKGCKGTRQHVGAGSYTLYALLGGHMGKAAQFSIS